MLETIFQSDSQISRQIFLKRIGGTAVLVTAGGLILSTADCGSPGLPRSLKFANLDDALAELEKVTNAKNVSVQGKWNPAQVFVHLAQSIEYSMTGYPENKPAIIRKTVGRIVLSRFLSQGYMTHNLGDPIPGAPVLDPTTPLSEAFGRLTRAIADFRAFQEKLCIHFVYDDVTKEEYEHVHAMHIANHLSAFTYS